MGPLTFESELYIINNKLNAVDFLYCLKSEGKNESR